jgi:negative modulator of initiation of replication
MKHIEVSDDVYSFLLRQVSFIGEDASSILRRLLQINPPTLARTGGAGTNLPKLPVSTPPVMAQTPIQVPQGNLDELLNDSRLRLERDVVQRFLHILGWLAREHPADFDGVTRISGRKRLYFSKSEAALKESGASVMPQRIPYTEYWVITNNDTPKKRRMLEDVLQMLRYPPAHRNLILQALG